MSKSGTIKNDKCTFKKYYLRTAYVHIVAPIVRITGYAVSLFLYVYQIRKGVVTSGALFTFWFLEAILGAITFRSVLKTNYVIGEEQMTPFTDFAVEYPIIVALFFLTCWAEPKPKYVNMDGKH